MISYSDRIRGMVLLAAYGDALGAAHELSTEIYTTPFPDILQPRQLPAVPSAWGTWIQNSLSAIKVGVPTDDTCYKFFILYPWLQSIGNNHNLITEDNFVSFLPNIILSEVPNEWIKNPRNTQIQNWIEMYKAEAANQCSHFFCPGKQVVFGLFMFLELAAILDKNISIIERYKILQTFTRLDQGYAKSVTGFLSTLMSLMGDYDPSIASFSDFYTENAERLFSELHDNLPFTLDQQIIRAVYDSSFQLAKTMIGKGPELFAKEMSNLLDNIYHVFDPLRFFAQITGAIVYSNGNVPLALRSIAFSTGDTDTTTSFLGTLLGFAYGYKNLTNFPFQEATFSKEINKVERCLSNDFGLDINSTVSMYVNLRDALSSPFAIV